MRTADIEPFVTLLFRQGLWRLELSVTSADNEDSCRSRAFIVPFRRDRSRTLLRNPIL